MTMAHSFGEVTAADWQAAGLIKPSVFKPVFTTIEQGLVLHVKIVVSSF